MSDFGKPGHVDMNALMPFMESLSTLNAFYRHFPFLEFCKTTMKLSFEILKAEKREKRYIKIRLSLPLNYSISSFEAVHPE